MLYVGNDHIVWVRGLYDRKLGSYVNDATVSLQVYDAAGATVGGASAAAYVAASNGVYVGDIDDAVTDLLVRGRDYDIVATITASSGRKRTLRRRLKAAESVG